MPNYRGDISATAAVVLLGPHSYNVFPTID